MATTAKKDTDIDKVLESDDPVVLKAKIRELTAAREEPKARKGWRILAPIANHEGTMNVPGKDDERVTLRFQNGEAFTDDVIVARKCASDFGYFTDPAFSDIDVHPTFIDPITREVREWMSPTGKRHEGSGIPDGYERRYAVRA